MNKTVILVMGLPGSGKTELSKKLKNEFISLGYSCDWFNADNLRTVHNDWDFSLEGRLRQASRMRSYATSSQCHYVICDFVCPLEEQREILDPDCVIWVDTIDSGRFEDTNRIFTKPEIYDFRVSKQQCEYYAKIIANRISNKIMYPDFDDKSPSVQQLGRFQPWHDGHRALFVRLLEKTGQVCIMVRDCQGVGDNPFDFEFIKDRIDRDLDFEFRGKYKVIKVPNIVHIGYGRDVGYTIKQEVFDQSVHDISATKIRTEMRQQGQLK